ncbi:MULTISPECIES: adenylyltransferase/cytidyltransferase family protein [Methanobrevibacter]|uniref:adenylyltransferase/cytidyltransferase family protein n=1 Tax=Methanobrevibacter TaxID=2172 RepID=UPI0025ED4AB1|nr:MULTISPECIES: adenylyltransferase/cytidyltransferase family protein [Methanobrevibacter]MBS7258781.1 adenylyltransferase/cytidyltransferase family protein [Methanobrevibacter sp.]MCI7429118.1 adenylyltransferase/cytidyltransferase family protein [Methanobrevibacter sp.]MDD6776568.1 adenylyltransferase/cytidyltransferase family protein [Methanobacteriaceae archaeon]MDY3097306.1 adenylyltransferase/cytidyltransferase family protein [Methanobrevibacter sp.]
MLILIGISADFDPVHKGHEKLIKEARKLADEKNKKVVVYLNKGFSANHAPFFASFEARKEMALALGADEVRCFEGLHHRLVLSYSVPIRLQQMIDDGVTDYITSASISLDEIKSKAQKFIDEGNFVGMPKHYTNRNEIRWYAINQFLGSKLEYHVVKELNKDKYSGRLIRQSIIDNDMTITDDVKKVLPKSTVDILQREIDAGNIPEERNWDDIYKRMNTYSRGNLEKIAYLNGNTINEIIKKRVYRDPESIWAVFRRSNYGPVMTRLAISAIEMDVTKKEVMDLMKSYESKGVIPDNQKVQRVIDRAWYVASSDLDAREANEKFRSEFIEVDAPLKLEAGLNLTKFETKITKEGINTDLYVDKKGKISVQFKSEGKKIKTNLRLPAVEVTYLRYIMDAHFIPVSGSIKKAKKGFKVEVVIG